MKTMVVFPKILYSVVFAICAIAMAAAFASRKKGGFRDRTCLMTVLLAGFCGVLVSIVYIFENRTVSGLFAVHLAFTLSPLFLQRFLGGGRIRFVVPFLVSAVVIAGVILSLFGGVSWNADRWIPPLMTAVLIILIVRNIWRLTDGRGRFDAVSVCREWMVSSVDILYYVVLVLFASVGLALGESATWKVAIGAFFCVGFLVGLFIAMWLRLRNGRAFLILSSREESYLGNINRSSKAAYMGNVECGLSGEELFSNLKEYFDKKMPYLNPGLSLSDVAKSLITNKVYLSRAINDFTGQNFCQFVNFYRVKYAIRLFNCNNAYRVADLATKSGFNCERSFIMAFRLYMNMSPSRWCKQNLQKHDGKVLRK